MSYIKRNEKGHIVAVSVEPMEGFAEVTEADAAEAAAFTEAAIGSEKHSFEQTDLDFVRVLEDLIELMMNKNIIQFTELPEASQSKMLARQKLRRKLKSHLDLLGNDDFLI